MSRKARLGNAHSGKLRPHEHTSYAALAVLVLLVGLMLSLLTISGVVSASPPPQSGSIGITGEMPGPPPKTGATITFPTNQQTFQNTPVTVSGTCPSGTLVEVFKNNVFAGSTPCTTDGTFSIQIDLLYGSNAITAVVYDDLNQAGPSSNQVMVTYNVQTPPTSSLLNINFASTQLVVETNAVYRGVFPGQQLNVPINIIGGVAPFAVNVNWGDDSNQVISSSSNTTVNASHTYSIPGIYKISIQASDSQQRVAFLDVAVIVNGQPASVGSTNGSSGPTNKLLILWPLYACAATLVVSFWMGEVREKHVLGEALQPIPKLGSGHHSY
ncbi:MAG TPA: hypothetical protein VFN56_04235 [Candidatus Saccharimonadales bacterium]|nr:hypothetical protein [Candidatus Saccharimonadales bacterium]